MTKSTSALGLAAIITALLVQTAFCAQRKITVNMVTGDVTFKRGSAEPKPVRKTTQIKEKDVIRTMVESSLELKLDDGSILTIEENSLIDLSKMVKDGEVTDTKVNIKTGKVLFNVKKLASKRSDFVFETPTATAAIRGTRGGIGTNGRRTFAFLEEGGLELKPRGGGKSVLIMTLNLAIQGAKGFRVQTAADAQALGKIMEVIEKQVMDTSAAQQNQDPGGDGTQLDAMLTALLDSAVLDSGLQGAPSDQAPADSAGAGRPDTSSAPADTSAAPDTSSAPTDTSAAPDTSPAPADTSAAPDTSSAPADTSAAPDTSSRAPADIAAAPLTLVFTSPAEGAEITEPSFTLIGTTLPGAVVTAKDKSATADASGAFSIPFTTPAKPGAYKIPASASLGGKTVKGGISFSVPERAVELSLSISEPAAGGQEFSQGSNVVVSGTVTIGAKVTVNGADAEVSGGAWKAVVPAAVPGEQTVLVEAKLGDQTKMMETAISIVKKQAVLEFSVNDPASGDAVRTPRIKISGTGTPGAKVVNGELETLISPSGAWSLTVSAPTKPGEFTFMLEAVLGDQTITRDLTLRVPEQELKLAILKPVDGAEITGGTIEVSGTASPGSKIQVFEAVATADQAGSWRVTIQSPRQEGEYQIEVKAVLNDQSRTEEIGIVRKIAEAPLKGTVNRVAAAVNKPELLLSGTCNDGATVEAGSFSTTSRGGTWSMTVSWPEEEEGAISLEVFCSYNDKEAVIGEVETQYTRPAIPLSLKLQTPLQVFQRTGDLTVQGEVTGRDVQVEVDGRGVPLISGRFSYKLSFSPDNWDMTEIEVSVSDEKEEISKTIELQIDKASPQINSRKPEFAGTPLIQDNGTLKFSMKDDPGDEVEVAILVDNDEEDHLSFEGSLAGRVFNLAGGIHDYRIEASDMAGNKAIWEQRAVPHWPRVEWSIVVEEPRQDVSIIVPPYTPDPDFVPSTDVRIRIRSLPNDDYRYLREVRIKNQANSAEEIWRDIEIDDIVFEFPDMPLVRQQTNLITIRVEPKNGPIRTVTRKFTLR